MDQHAEMKEALKRRRGKGIDLTVVMGGHKDETPGAKQGPDEELHDDQSAEDRELAPDVHDGGNADADHDPLDEGQPNLHGELSGDHEKQHESDGAEHPMEKMLDGEMGMTPLHRAAMAHHSKAESEHMKHLAGKHHEDVSHLGPKGIKSSDEHQPHEAMNEAVKRKMMAKAKMAKGKLAHEGGAEDHDGGGSDGDGY
jgi:hypothetical protein